LTSSLLYLEEREILHQNVKPSSIFLTADYSPKLGDFTHAHYFAMPPTTTSAVSPFSPPVFIKN